MNKYALVFAPHPDDAEFFAGGLVAKLVKEGANVTIITATDGCCGSFTAARDQLIEIRHEEAMKAAEVIGAKVVLLGYHDYELDQLAPGVLREQLIRIIRKMKPDIVVTIDPFANNEVHPDHRALAWASGDAVNHSGLPLIYPHHFVEGLTPHFVFEKYYYSEDFSLHNKIVDITPYLNQKIEAMKAHHSQVEFLVDDFYRQAEIAGIDLKQVLGPMMDSPFLALAYALTTQAEQVGSKIKVKYAESYRYTRFHAFIENILEQQGNKG
jgi:N,N'-diacetylchitobiose non-reducing end deacetylase